MIKFLLASKANINGDIEYNKNVITETMINHSKDVDMIIFGEAFLQGFYALTFDLKHDMNVAVELDSDVVKEICQDAKTHHIGVSFGFVEKDGENIYSSQMTIDKDGNIVDVYRRVSVGWKEEYAGGNYREGDGFHAFEYMGKKVVVGLCGDLWYDENIDKVNACCPDVVFWPVYTDFNSHKWNTTEKYEYAEQAGKLFAKVLYVNSVCTDIEGDEIAKGGSALFENGKIIKETPSGKESTLLVEI